MSRPIPNLFVVGSMKSGTTSLHRYLVTHPEIFMTEDPKEPTYFLELEQLRDVLPGLEKRGIWRGLDAYLRLFEGAEGFPVVGEASANYARLNRVPGVAGRVARFNPEARILFIARDPIERTISHYWYMVRFFEERRDMFSAIRDEPDYTETSYYAMQLRAWLAEFPEEQVHVITTEALRDRPEATMCGVFEWLGVEPAFEPPNLRERANVAPPVVGQVAGSGMLNRFRHSALWNSLGPRVPAGLRQLGRRLSERKVPRAEVDRTPTERWLRGMQQQQTLELGEMLGRDFPEWTTLHAAE